MPALKPTKFVGEIVWLGRVDDRSASLRATPMDEVMATFAGVEGEEHAGLTRPSCSRVTSQYPRGTTIRNVRQFSILSQEELEEIARKMDVEAVNPSWLGASIVVSGIPDLTHVPPSSRFQTKSGTTLTVDMENRPCHLPAEVIDEEIAGAGRAFKAAASGLRGVTAWVEREGPLRIKDALTLHVPDQRAWMHLDEG